MDFDDDLLRRFLADQNSAHAGRTELADGLWLLFAVPADDPAQSALARAALDGAPFPHHEGASEDDAWLLHYVEEAHRPAALHWLDDLARREAGEIRPASPAAKALVQDLAAGAKPHRAAQQLAELHARGEVTAGLIRDRAAVRALLDRLHQHEPLFFAAFLNLLNHHLIDLVVLLRQLITEDVAVLNEIVKGGLSHDPFLQSRQDSAAEIRQALVRAHVINAIDQQKNTSLANPYAALLEIVSDGATVSAPLDGLQLALPRANVLAAIRSTRRKLHRGEPFDSLGTQAPWITAEIAQPFRFLKQRIDSRRDLAPLDALYMIERALDTD